MKRDFGILGLWHGKNYGAVFTSYALYRKMETLGYQVSLLDIGVPTPSDSETVFRKFIQDEQIHTTKVQIETAYELNQVFDGYLVGSDMLWVFNLENYFFFLDFASKEKRKVSYSTSMNSYQQKPLLYRWKISALLNRFDAISFRETHLQKYFKQQYNADGPCVIDPVFLLPKEHWVKLAEKARFIHKESFIAAYILDPTRNKSELLSSISRQRNIPVHTVVDATPSSIEAATKYGFSNVCAEINLYEFLARILHCEYFVTDSFHGMCFAIIFNKPFIVIKNTYRGAARFESLAHMLDCDRLLISEDDSSLPLNNLEVPKWELINANLNCRINDAEEWLIRALTSSRKNKLFSFSNLFVNTGTKFNRTINLIFYYLIRIEYKFMRQFCKIC